MSKLNPNQDQTIAKLQLSSKSDLNNHASFAAKLQQGDSSWQAGEIESAVECYRQAAQLNPNNAVVHQKLAMALKHKGDLIGSLKSYHRAIAASGAGLRRGPLVPPCDDGISRSPIAIKSGDRAKVEIKSKSNIYPTAKMNSDEFDSKQGSPPHQNYAFHPVKKTDLDQQWNNHLPTPPSTIKIKSNQTTNNPITYSLASVNSKPVTRNSAMMPAAELYLEQAKIFVQQQQWQGAIEACQQALAIAPNLAQAYKIWGNALQRAGQIPEALGCYAKALTIDPGFVEIYANVGSLYASQQQWQEALKYYQKALEVNPQFAGVYQNIAKVLDRLGRPQQALEYQYQAFKIEPARFDGVKHYQLANQLLEIGKAAEAIICYRNAIKLAPDLIPAYQKLADTLEQQGQWEEAANFYQQLLKIDAKQTQGETKQLVYTPERKALPQAEQQSAKSNKIEQQLQRYLAIAKSKPDSATIQANLGSLYAQQQKWTEAIAAYQRAIRLDPKFAGAYRNLAKVYRQLDQEEQAARCWQKALQLQPNQASATEHLEVGKLLLNQKKKRSNSAF